ncbi:MAG: 1-phosphofructokinase family hexose kinase [Halanaerobiaceae bacterium]
MITTVTLNPSIDREYFVNLEGENDNHFIYEPEDLKVYPGGKGVLSAINLKNIGYQDVQNIGFIGGKQGLFFEKMVQEYRVTTNYVYTKNEMRNNIKLVGKNLAKMVYYNDYTYRVDKRDVEELKKRFKRGITDSKLIMISGSIPEGVDFGIYRDLVKICHNLDKKVYLQASGEALKQALEAEPEFVVPYFKHTNKILDVEVNSMDDYVRMGRELLEAGADSVILPYKCDRLLFSGSRVYSLSPEGLCLRSWLGAGDAYNAAFFDFIFQNGYDFLEANRYAGAAALDIAEGRIIFLDGRDRIEENIKRIIVEELEV